MKLLSIISFGVLSMSLSVESMGQGGFFAGIHASGNATIVANQQNYGQKEMDYDGVTFHPSFGIQLGYDLNGAHLLSIGAGIQKGGQKYKDGYGNGDQLRKEIKLDYISVPVTYTHVFGGAKDPNNGTKFFISVGPQFSLLQKSTVTHEVNGQDATLSNFANHVAGGGAPYQFNSVELAALTTNGDPADDKDLFQSMDVQAFLGIGIQSYLSEYLFLTLELRGGGSITDINADEWQLDGYKDGKRQEYEASRNVFGGLRIGLNYKF